MSERVSVVIPNWNGWKFLQPCLLSMRKQVFTDYSIVVVDNGSQDGSVELVRKHFPAVKIISFEVNRGFASAVNAGIAATSSEFVVALNNDTEVDPDWLRVLVKTLDARPDIGFAASMILTLHDSSIIDCIGDGYSFMGLSFKIGEQRKNTGQYTEPFEVFGACAAASIYRRSMIEDIGAFDDEFFAYMEDVELSLRARLAGYRCLAVPGAIVYHFGSGSSGGDNSAFSIQMTAKNLIYILVKIIPGRLLVRMIPVAFAAQLALVLACLTTGRYPGLRRNLGVYARGLYSGFRGAGLMLNKRRQVRPLRRIGARDLTRMIALSEAQRREEVLSRLSWSNEARES